MPISSRCRYVAPAPCLANTVGIGACMPYDMPVTGETANTIGTASLVRAREGRRNIIKQSGIKKWCLIPRF